MPRKVRSDCTVGTFEKTRGLPPGTIPDPDGRDTRSDKKIGTIRKKLRRKMVNSHSYRSSCREFLAQTNSVILPIGAQRRSFPFSAATASRACSMRWAAAMNVDGGIFKGRRSGSRVLARPGGVCRSQREMLRHHLARACVGADQVLAQGHGLPCVRIIRWLSYRGEPQHVPESARPSDSPLVRSNFP